MAKRSLNVSITLTLGTFSLISGLEVFCIDLQHAIISFQGGSSATGSSDFLKYAFFFVRLSEMSVKARPHDGTYSANILLTVSTTFQWPF